MGCGPSKLDPAEQEAQVRSEKIERQIKQAKKEEERTVKILLLGK